MEQYGKVMKENLIKPELEIYDLGVVFNVQLVRKQGIFEEPMHFQMVFGVAGGIQYDTFNFARIKELLLSGASWSVCGAGPNQFAAGMTAAVNGGDIRVGLEDNIRMPKEILQREAMSRSDGQLMWPAWQAVRLPLPMRQGRYSIC